MTHRTGRTIAIGDIHGCLTALNTLLDQISPKPEDLIITLGDYVDRGPDSKGVIDRLIRLSHECQLVPLLGNHDQVMVEYLMGRLDLPTWLAMGGNATLESYGFSGSSDVFLDSHVEFLKNCLPFFELETHFFVHANYHPKKPLEKQAFDVLLWQTIRDALPPPHRSGKTAVVGHTSQRSGNILYAGHLICIDTGCCYGNWLTAIEVYEAEMWQTNDQGGVRS